MSKQNEILRIGLALFSAITSFLFVFYAVNVISGSSVAEGLDIFAYVVGGYGLMNIYMLSWAWRSHAAWTVSANLLIAACLFAAVIIDLIRNGLPNNLPFLAIPGLLVVLGINWFALKKLCQ